MPIPLLRHLLDIPSLAKLIHGALRHVQSRAEHGLVHHTHVYVVDVHAQTFGIFPHIELLRFIVLALRHLALVVRVHATPVVLDHLKLILRLDNHLLNGDSYLPLIVVGVVVFPVGDSPVGPIDADLPPHLPVAVQKYDVVIHIVVPAHDRQMDAVGGGPKLDPLGTRSGRDGHRNIDLVLRLLPSVRVGYANTATELGWRSLRRRRFPGSQDAGGA